MTEMLTPVVPGQIGSIVNVIEGLQALPPLQKGVFCDYATGVHGVDILATDRPSQFRLDAVNISNSAVGSVTYADDVLLDPIPMMMKCNSTGGASTLNNYWTHHSLYDRETPHYGTLYFYMDGALPVDLAFCDFSKVTVLAYRLKFKSATSTFNIETAGPTVRAASSYVLHPGTFYRLEWKVVQGAGGSVELRIFVGHATTPADTISATFDTGAWVDGFQWGSVAGVDLANIPFRVGAVGIYADDWIGPYTGPRGVYPIDDPFPMELHNTGKLVLKAWEDTSYDLGPSAPHAIIKAGSPIVTLDVTGSGVRVGDPTMTYSDNTFRDALQQVVFQLGAARPKFSSLTMISISDPADITLQRREPLNGALSGTGASTVAGSDIVTFSDYELHMYDEGRSATIDGVGYNIYDILGPNSCTVKPTPSATGSGLAWSIYVYPKLIEGQAGLIGGSAVGQIRYGAPAAQAVRSGTGTATSNGTTGLVITDFNGTTADIDRALMLNNEPALTAPASASTCPLITAASGSAVTVDRVVPARANVDWALTEATHVGDALDPQFNFATFSCKLQTDSRHWYKAATTTITGVNALNSATVNVADTSLLPSAGTVSFLSTSVTYTAKTATSLTGCSNHPATAGGETVTSGGANQYSASPLWEFTGMRSDSLYGSQSGQDTFLQINGQGEVLAFSPIGGLGYGNGAGTVATQGSSKSTTVPINAPTGKITTHNAALAAGASVSFVVTNTVVEVDDTVRLNMRSGGTVGAYRLGVDAIAAGSFTITLQNVTAGSLSEAVAINFSVLKGDS